MRRARWRRVLAALGKGLVYTLAALLILLGGLLAAVETARGGAEAR